MCQILEDLKFALESFRSVTHFEPNNTSYVAKTIWQLDYLMGPHCKGARDELVTRAGMGDKFWLPKLNKRIESAEESLTFIKASELQRYGVTSARGLQCLRLADGLKKFRKELNQAVTAKKAA